MTTKPSVNTVLCVMRISVEKATYFGFKVATHRSAATLVDLGWVSGFFESSLL